MSKRLTITMPDWVYEKYLSQVAINKSQYITGHFVQGVEYSCGEIETTKQRLLESLKEVRSKEDQLVRMKKELTLLKSKIRNNSKTHLTDVERNNCGFAPDNYNCSKKLIGPIGPGPSHKQSCAECSYHPSSKLYKK